MNKEIRKKLIENAFNKKLGHVGSALSCIDCIEYLFDNIMNEDDIFILSKGHGAMALYSVLEKKGIESDWNMHPELDEEKVSCN
jgi:transketolase